MLNNHRRVNSTAVKTTASRLIFHPVTSTKAFGPNFAGKIWDSIRSIENGMNTKTQKKRLSVKT